MRKRHVVILLAVVAFGVLPARAGADHISEVAGVTIRSDDPGVTPVVDAHCPMIHYHGNLNIYDLVFGAWFFVLDPGGECGHGLVTPLQHLSGDHVAPWPESNPWTNAGWCDANGANHANGVSRTVVTTTIAFRPGLPGAPEGTTVAQEGERSLCDRFLDFFRDRPEPTDWADAAFQGASGGFSPKTVADATDIVVEAAPSIKAKIDNINQYTQVYGPLIRTKPKPPAPTLSQRFWRGAASVIFFWD